MNSLFPFSAGFRRIALALRNREGAARSRTGEEEAYAAERSEQARWIVRRFDSRHFEHPGSEAALVELVQRARSTGAQLRIRGSEHSVARAVYTDDFDPETGASEGRRRPVINVMLDRYRGVDIRPEQGLVVVDAGCNIGGDPYGPGESRRVEESLAHRLHAAGFALPVLGGISHQTISGFLGTGSAGASVQHTIGDAIVAFRVIDGLGRVHEIERGDPLFGAVGTSMGLLGIISKVTLRIEPSYGLRGWASTQRFDDCEIDLFGPGDASRPSLERFFREEPYARLMVWPQRGVEKVEIWRAERIPWPRGSKPRPFQQFKVFSREMQWLVRLLYQRVLAKVPEDAPLDLERRVVSSAINAFIQAKKVDGRYVREAFEDVWYEALPHDNQMDDQLMPILFTELWIPLHRTEEVMGALRDLWGSGSLRDTGSFCTEIYAAGASPFFLNAAYDTPVLRIDPFVFLGDSVDAEGDYFPRYWELLRRFDFRFHWGKSLSDPESSTGVAYRRHAVGPEPWDAFMKLRRAMDPEDIFLSSYWAAHLGIRGGALEERSDGLPRARTAPIAG